MEIICYALYYFCNSFSKVFHFVTYHRFTALALVKSGFSRLTRKTRADQACVLTFHGVLDPSDEAGTLDLQQHTSLPVFRNICRHLASRYHVAPALDIVRAVAQGRSLRPNTVAITFDDGYASNYHLAFPVLREFGLPATIFACTGFIDGIERLWFNRLDHAFASTPLPWATVEIGGKTLRLPLATREDRIASMHEVLPAVKKLDQSEIASAIERIEQQLQVAAAPVEDFPAPLRPMTWGQAREMRASGLIDFGAHTHRHPILARCSPEGAREEIMQSRARLMEEMGEMPTLFAYTNGTANDYDDGTMALLREAGFEAAFTMRPGFVRRGLNPFEFPRYGSPENMSETEATVSGAFETFKEWRSRVRQAFASFIP